MAAQGVHDGLVKAMALSPEPHTPHQDAFCASASLHRGIWLHRCFSRRGPPADPVSGTPPAGCRLPSHFGCAFQCPSRAPSTRTPIDGVFQSANALSPQGCRPTFAARPTQCPKLLPVSRLDATVAAAPTGVALPRKGCPHRAPWSRGVRERSQRHRHDACLHVATPGVAAWIAERKVGEEKARHAAVFDDVQGRPNDHGRNAIGFEVAGGQTHGLVALSSTAINRKSLDCANPTWVIKRARMKGSATILCRYRHLLRSSSETPSRPMAGVIRISERVKGNHFVRQTVARAMQPVCARADITGLRAHDFRRSINSWLHDEGVGYDVRSRLMAHSPPDKGVAEQRYAHGFPTRHQ